MRDKILIVAAHPDDEVLGCGGTMARHAAAGDRVDIFIAAEGATSRDEVRNAGARAREIAALRKSAAKAATVLGARAPRFGGFPDNRMDSVPLLEVTKAIEALVAELRPRVVYTHHAGDLNVDHRVVHQAVVTACRPQPGHCVDSLLFFEVPSSTEWQTAGSAAPFVPNYFVDIAGFEKAKRRALAAYAAEMRPWPHARSIEAVAARGRHRGAGVGVAAAEAFMAGRLMIR
jgi:LmbE family N-acetylglucosaminyl deacetylase